MVFPPNFIPNFFPFISRQNGDLKEVAKIIQLLNGGVGIQTRQVRYQILTPKEACQL